MASQFWQGAAARAALTSSLMAGLAASIILPHPDPAFAAAQTNTSFPDTEGHWGQPFIQALAEREIVTGFLDNTYRPEQTLKRDEFAAILRKAFSQPAERQLASGSIYTDIPAGYWAAQPIEDAYEMGFMKGYPEGDFRPDQPVTKVEILASLAGNMELPPVTVQTAPVVSRQPATQRIAKRPLMFPLAMTTLMQPLMKAPEKPAPAANSAQPNAAQAAPLNVADYYQDAAQIPQYAGEPVAEATAAGIVVNYPDIRILNPNQPATRGEAAALIHQALVYQGKISPLPNDSAAENYVVRP